MRTILIIKCGETNPELVEKAGDFEHWIINQSNLPSNVFKIINIAEGDLPKHPSEYMAAIISGSQANVNQRMDWIKQLKNWIITARYSNVPVLGICFGHQIIAEALGGSVKQIAKGPKIGIHTINLTREGKKNILFKQCGSSMESYKLNAFEVVNLPLFAELLATGDDSSVEAFRIDKMYGIQFHAEFTPEIMRYYLNNSKIEGASKLRVRLKSSFKNHSIISNFLDDVSKF